MYCAKKLWVVFVLSIGLTMLLIGCRKKEEAAPVKEAPGAEGAREFTIEEQKLPQPGQPGQIPPTPFPDPEAARKITQSSLEKRVAEVGEKEFGFIISRGDLHIKSISLGL